MIGDVYCKGCGVALAEEGSEDLEDYLRVDGNYYCGACPERGMVQIAALRAQLAAMTARAEAAEKERDRFIAELLHDRESYTERVVAAKRERDEWRARAEGAEAKLKALEAFVAAFDNIKGATSADDLVVRIKTMNAARDALRKGEG